MIGVVPSEFNYRDSLASILCVLPSITPIYLRKLTMMKRQVPLFFIIFRALVAQPLNETWPPRRSDRCLEARVYSC